MAEEMLETYTVESPDQAMVLLNPLRAEILSILSDPSSAAEVGRKIDEPPQRVNYHLKALEKVGLVQKVGTRQVRNLVEVLYQAIAKTFILSELLGWSPETVQRLKDQSSLAHLVTTAERIKKDALLLLERTDHNEEIPSATLQSKVHLPTEDMRNAFIEDYVAMVKELVQKYSSSDQNDNGFNVTLAVYPETAKGGDDH